MIQSFGMIASERGLNSVYSSWGSSSFWGGPLGLVTESYAGAWQQNVTVAPTTTLLSFSAVYACVTGIASDIAKNRIKLSLVDDDGIWEEITEAHGNSAESSLLPILKKPNRYQNRIKFIEQWIISKLLYGNAYILKERKNRIVTSLYVLHPASVTPLVSDDGGVYYKISRDYLSGVKEDVTVPASEIIHDMMESLWHPLVGISPIWACALSATMGNTIQSNATQFNANKSFPGGMITAPAGITNEAAAEIKAAFATGFTGTNIGKIAVVGADLKFEQFGMSAVNAQQNENLRWTVEDVARSFHYPVWMLGGPLPPYSSGPEALTLMYYSQCLQSLIESLELCLDEGLEMPDKIHAEVDLDNLLRMDTNSLFESNNKGVSGQWMAANEARSRANLKPVKGGETPMGQMQYWPLDELANRPSLSTPPPVAPPPALAAKEPAPQLPADTQRELTASNLLRIKTRAMQSCKAA